MTSSGNAGGGLGGLYRLFGLAALLGAAGLVALATTAGVGDPGVVGRAGVAAVGGSLVLVGGAILRNREAVAATEARYDYGVAGTTLIGATFAAAGACGVLAAFVL